MTEQGKQQAQDTTTAPRQKGSQTQQPVEAGRKAVHGPPNDKALKPQQDKG